MCGIFAVYGAHNHINCHRRLRALTVECAKCLRHRGPDWSDLYQNAKTGTILAHERLSIIDPETGDQPIIAGQNRILPITAPSTDAPIKLNRRIAAIVNGEIYNYKLLSEEFSSDPAADNYYEFRTKSDSEVLIPLYLRYGPSDMATRLNGMFAAVIYDVDADRLIALRDHVGIAPFYWGNIITPTKKGLRPAMVFASEMKAFFATRGSQWSSQVAPSDPPTASATCRCYDQTAASLFPTHFNIFPPGYLWDSDSLSGNATDGFKLHLEQWYKPGWALPDPSAGLPPPNYAYSEASMGLANICEEIRQILEAAVAARTISDVPWGVLLSGGLDSSLVASIVVRNHFLAKGLPPANLHTFSVGFPDSPDLLAAQKAASFLGTTHHHFQITVEEALDVLPAAIWHMESYDPEIVESATPHYLMARRIKSMGIKMVLTGEGADELFAGYTIFHPKYTLDRNDVSAHDIFAETSANNPAIFHATLIDSIALMETHALRRNNKISGAFGVEPRIPYLDPSMIALAMAIDPTLKQLDPKSRPIEKYILRAAFDPSINHHIPKSSERARTISKTPSGVSTNSARGEYLPKDVLWRTKDRMGSGVGTSWAGALKKYANELISDEAFAKGYAKFTFNTPKTKEALLYREIFEGQFSNSDCAAATVYRSWTEAMREMKSLGSTFPRKNLNCV